MGDCYGVNLERGMTTENLHYFIRASLQTLQDADGYEGVDSVCPLYGRKAYIKYLRDEIYDIGEIECRCGYSFHLQS